MPWKFDYISHSSLQFHCLPEVRFHFYFKFIIFPVHLVTVSRAKHTKFKTGPRKRHEQNRLLLFGVFNIYLCAIL